MSDVKMGKKSVGGDYTPQNLIVKLVYLYKDLWFYSSKPKHTLWFSYEIFAITQR